ncbi:hypothetical protein ABH908_003048 [Pseudomonas frederiksbergensis]|jgi:hypothetical protein|uniref:hypothetical protein n=1 Tax=Pseudomonas TaxID=286 RepID=UPI000DB57334|nr:MULTISPECIES: hypothetical protein [unclassified Pseudomonas]MBD9616004.1 hypothetical protein [Pseudomonas sp. PDM07]PZW64751.1 hypothetical protein F475_00819 [Pseudomonas sp. URMO17WK12:I6]QDV95469.1 hypothetical protein FFH90_014655 [Pseudomonas sp. ATCC 43928]
MNSTKVTATGYLTGDSSKYGHFEATQKTVRYPSYPPPHSELRIIGMDPFNGGSHGVILVIKRSEIIKGEYNIAEDTDITAIYNAGEPSYFDNNGTLNIEEFNSEKQHIKGQFNFKSGKAEITVSGEFELTGFDSTV